MILASNLLYTAEKEFRCSLNSCKMMDNANFFKFEVA